MTTVPNTALWHNYIVIVYWAQCLVPYSSSIITPRLVLDTTYYITLTIIEATKSPKNKSRDLLNELSQI